MDDSELIARSREDHGAFAELFDRHSDAVFRYAFGLTHDADLAQELVQETFITAWKKLADIHLFGDSMLPWLLVCCRNHCANQRRSRERWETLPLDDRIVAPGNDALETMAQLAELEWARTAVAQLSELDQRIVFLCLYQEHSYREAAGLLGIRTNTLTKRVQRLRERLRTQRRFREGEARS